MIQFKEHFPALDASTLIALRLSRQHDKKDETTFINHVKQDIVGKNLTSGQLALSLLALTATCQTSMIVEFNLVKNLEQKFQEEVDNIDVTGYPLTNYYQLGLDVLALCLLNGTYSSSKIAELFSVEPKKYYFSGQLSVDTASLAVLALTCVNRKKPDKMIGRNISCLVEKILSEKKQDGVIGNIYSTGEAMQALFVSSEYYEKREWNCNQTLQTMLNQISQNLFILPMSAAQLLPALEGKTYLDVTHVSCQSSPDHFNITTPKPVEPTHQCKENISAIYSVVDCIKNRINETIIISVPKGSVFLKVMEAAQKQDSKFRFTIKTTNWGPFVTSIDDIQASNKNGTYWELLNNGQPLNQGVGSFVVSNGDNLVIRLVKFNEPDTGRVSNHTQPLYPTCPSVQSTP
ncbi:transcobalamin-1 isoform X2 [Macrotis lagotis]